MSEKILKKLQKLKSGKNRKLKDIFERKLLEKQYFFKN